MKAALLLLAFLLTAPAHAQWHREKGPHGRPPSHLSQEDRQRLREDVDAARYGRHDRDDRQRQRLAPEEREKLRRDVQDANREMRRNRR